MLPTLWGRQWVVLPHPMGKAVGCVAPPYGEGSGLCCWVIAPPYGGRALLGYCPTLWGEGIAGLLPHPMGEGHCWVIAPPCGLCCYGEDVGAKAMQTCLPSQADVALYP